MKRVLKTLTVGLLSAAMVLPVGTTPIADAAAKPKLSEEQVPIFTGHKKTILIKNVKKKDIKSLKVVSMNKKSTKVVKRILTKKKVGFVLKAVGAHSSQIKVKLTLNKAIAGKTKYNLKMTTITGKPDAPDSNLYDGVKQSDHHASVFKVGEEPAEWENWIELKVENLDDFNSHNLSVIWKENGKTGVGSMIGSFLYRPDTSTIHDTEKGYDEGVVTCEAMNTVSREVDTDDHIYRVVSQDYIDKCTQTLKGFVEKYPYKTLSDIPKDKDKQTQMKKDYMSLLKSYGFLLGLTHETINYWGDIYLDSTTDTSKDANAILSDEADIFEKECKLNGKNLGIPDEDITQFCDLLDLMFRHGVDEGTSKKKQDKQLQLCGDNDTTIEYYNKCGFVADLYIHGYYKDEMYQYETDSCAIGESDSVVISDPMEGDFVNFDLGVWCVVWCYCHIKEPVPQFPLTPGTIEVTSKGATIFNTYSFDIRTQDGSGGSYPIDS